MGRPQFAQAGTDGGGQTVAVTNRPEIEEIHAGVDDPIAGNGTVEVTEIYAPTGSVYNVLNAQIRARNPDAATEGTHRFIIESISNAFGVTQCRASYTDTLWFRWNNWMRPDSPLALYPDPDRVSPMDAIQVLKATENAPIRIQYENNTDAENDDNVQMFLVEEVTY